jgi:hypothetical protein
MFLWERLEDDFGVTKSPKDLIKSEDGIHCEECREHLSDHGVIDGKLLHPMDIVNLLKGKE